MINIDNNSTKYCIIGKKDWFSKRGAYIVTKRFTNTLNKSFGNNFIFKNDDDILDILNESNNYNKMIFTYQNCFAYNFGFDIKEIYQIKDKSIVFTRNNIYAKLLESATNGFSTYNEMKIHKNYIPLITDFKLTKKYEKINKEIKKEPIVGFYSRNFVTSDVILYFQDELSKLKYPISLVTCGVKDNIFYNSNKIKNHYHTNNNNDFFSRITHYYFPQSATFIDPFPNMLLEAIQLNKQIISPQLPNRKHKDGIDDLLSIIKYHKKLSSLLSDKEYNNKDHPLVYKNFKKFYSLLLSNDFKYSFSYGKYKNFCEWISSVI